MQHIWQDSPEYGCDDNPSYKWFGSANVGGHIARTVGPFSTREECQKALGIAPVRYGTSDFQSITAARHYYARQGIDFAAVKAKLAEGEISIGKPDNLKDGDVFHWDMDGRGEIIEAQRE